MNFKKFMVTALLATFGIYVLAVLYVKLIGQLP